MRPKSSLEISGDRSRSLLFLTGSSSRLSLYERLYTANGIGRIQNQQCHHGRGRGQACLRNRNLDMPASLRSVSVPSRGKHRQIGGNTASSHTRQSDGAFLLREQKPTE